MIFDSSQTFTGPYAYTVSTALFGSYRSEFHAVIEPQAMQEPFRIQQEAVEEALHRLDAKCEESGMHPVFLRIYLSDAANQADRLRIPSDRPVSVIQQAPLKGVKIAVLAIYGPDPMEERTPGVWKSESGKMCITGRHLDPASSHRMTVEALRHTDSVLRANGGSLLGNCLRTWFFVRDIDMNYTGVVEGRNRVFAELGLTTDTHFIASTGIEGKPAVPKAAIAYEACADLSVQPGQVRQLRGLSHLSPTVRYGVAFERGTAIDYADRTHIIISGTASIDSEGEVVAPGDIAGQTHRMLENVRVLLEEGGASPADAAHMVVYLRDPADYGTVERIIESELPGVPRLTVLGAVCRPAWLVECECMAIIPNADDRLPRF